MVVSPEVDLYFNIEIIPQHHFKTTLLLLLLALFYMTPAATVYSVLRPISAPSEYG